MEVFSIAVLVALLAWSDSTSGLKVMNEAWYPVIVGGLVSALSAAAIWGSTIRGQKDLERRTTDLEKSDDKQWAEISDLGERVTWVEAKANGKGTR